MISPKSMKADHKTLILNVAGLSCQGCVSKVRKSIQEKCPEAIVDGSPKENKLQITSDLDLDTLNLSIQEAGYKCLGLLYNERDQDNPVVNNKDTDIDIKEQDISNDSTKSFSYELSISGMTCAGCVNTVQKALSHSAEVITANVNFASHTAQVVSKGPVESLIKAVENAGYHASLILDKEKTEGQRKQRELTEYRYKSRSSVMGLALGIPLMLYGLVGGNMSVSSLNERVVWFFIGIVTLLIMISAGKHYFRGAWKAFINHQANMDLLIALGTGSAWLYSMIVVLAPSNWLPDNTQHLYFEAAVMIIGLINLGQALELKARRKTSQALHRLLDLRPKMATRVDGDKETRVKVSEIILGDILRVRTGDKIPVDGEVIEGTSMNPC